ncbi:hypothetical protein E1L19_23515 [Salmonella enterica subsp. enterica]|nr:hypothetical protein [Salmonella enterica]ECH9262234.1 hypothetical protein [Salmonella enterica subsp. enterica]ECV7800769.1 hypothetical protein [Salmonella enterica subsp. enterica serovar Brandenburg]ECI7828896.1 hypothetical protein [Salmonella enterica subsp. enterica]EDW9589379.1 hypothetical protein [Salmonella enterica subsp. enterica]
MRENTVLFLLLAAGFPCFTTQAVLKDATTVIKVTTPVVFTHTLTTKGVIHDGELAAGTVLASGQIRADHALNMMKLSWVRDVNPEIPGAGKMVRARSARLMRVDGTSDEFIEVNIVPVSHVLEKGGDYDEVQYLPVYADSPLNGMDYAIKENPSSPVIVKAGTYRMAIRADFEGV